MFRTTLFLQFFFVSVLFLAYLHTFQTQNPLRLSCESDAVCLNQSNHSKCSSSKECICLLGFYRNGSSCVQANCFNASDCTFHFENTTCSKEGTNNSICICDSTHYLDDATQNCLQLNAKSIGYWWIGIILGVFLIILFGSVCFLYQYKLRETATKRLLDPNEDHQENNRQDYNTIRESNAE